MSVYKFSITKKQIDTIPENESAFFLQSTVMINEINILFKTIYFNKAANQNEIEKPPDGHFKIPHLWPGQNPPATEY